MGLRGWALAVSAGVMTACGSATPAAPTSGGVEVAPMVFRCDGWRHAISLVQDGSIMADGRKVAWIEDGRMRLRGGAWCELDRDGVLVDQKGNSCTGRRLQVLPDHTLRSESGVVRFEGERLVFGTDGGVEERVCQVQGYREGREGAVAMLLATAGVVVMVDAIGAFARSGERRGEDGADAGRD